MSIGIATVLSAAALVSLHAGCDSAAHSPQGALAAAPQARYQVDRARNRVWMLDQEGVVALERARSERITPALAGWVSATSEFACLPDLALGPRGEAVITSNVLPILWRVDPQTLAVTVHRLALDADAGKDVGFSGLVYSREHGAYFAASYSHGTLWRIDERLERAQKVALSAPLPQVCGLALRTRGPRQRGSRPALCAYSAHDDWGIVFAPDARTAYVGAAPCADPR